MAEIYVIDGESDIEVEDQLRRALTDMTMRLNNNSDGFAEHGVSYSNGANTPNHNRTTLPSAHGGFAIVINGHSLVSDWFCSIHKHLLYPRTEQNALDLPELAASPYLICDVYMDV